MRSQPKPHFDSYNFAFRNVLKKGEFVESLTRDSAPSVEDMTHCLYKAIQQNDIEIAKLLLEKGANINDSITHCTDKNVFITPLLAVAIQYDRKEIFSAMMGRLNNRSESGSFSTLLEYVKNKSNGTFYANQFLAKESSFFHTLSPKERGRSVLQYLRANLHSPKTVFDCLKILDSDIQFEYESQIDEFASAERRLSTIINNIAEDPTLSRKAKQMLVLHHINIAFQKANTQGEMMKLTTALEKDTSAKAKEFLMEPQKYTVSLFNRWSDKPVCRFWSSIMKFAKVRLFEVVKQPNELGKEAITFLNKKRSTLGFYTQSQEILGTNDPVLRNQKIETEKENLNRELTQQFGLRR